jgi:hypothetical protein
MAQMISNVTISSKKQKQKKDFNLLDFEIFEEPIIPDIYMIERKPYVSSEFIPSSIIPTIISHNFNSAELVFAYNENHAIYKMMIKDLLVDSVVNWEFNRPPDMGRCPDIARYIYNSRKPVDTMIYLSFNNLKETFEVLDGIHRITALKMIKEENSKPIDLLERHEFGSENDALWLYNKYIIVNIRFNAPLGELAEVFTNLNKSQTVPNLYIHDYNKEKKDIIENIANEWFVKYKKHFSSSNNPNLGNTNRNKFVDLLDKLYEKYKIRQCNSVKLIKILDNANMRMSENISTKISIDVRVKCKETGCFLFLFKNDKLEEFI